MMCSWTRAYIFPQFETQNEFMSINIVKYVKYAHSEQAIWMALPIYLF